MQFKIEVFLQFSTRRDMRISLLLHFYILLLIIIGCSKAPITNANIDASTEPSDDSVSDITTDAGLNLPFDDLSIEMIPLEPGSFWMGAPDGNCPQDYPGGENCVAEGWQLGDEKLHYVKLTRTFEIQKMETTRQDYEIVMRWDPVDGTAVPLALYDRPVDSVNHAEAMAFANELSKRKNLSHCFVLTDVTCMDGTVMDDDADDTACAFGGHWGIMDARVGLNNIPTIYDCEGYRLPTEAEWEYAARAGCLTAFHPSPGNDGSITQMENDPNLIQVGWEYGNSGNETHPIGEKEPNAWGLYDVHGNVQELVFDDYVPYSDCNTQNPCVDPVVFTENVLPPETKRVIRGGSYELPAAFARCAKRNNTARAGVRLVRTLPKSNKNFATIIGGNNETNLFD